MKSFATRIAVVCTLAALAACGSDSKTSSISTSNARGTLVENPPFRIASLDAAAFKAELSASAFAPLLPLTGDPACGVDFHYIHYWTVGGNDEPEYATGALMIPNGTSPQCTGPLPILLYAHGTQVDRTINIADPTDPNNKEGVLVAAMFAAQGYIVVAPNYVGYDTSTASYHPYLNEDAESKDMIDALTASRSALGKVLASGASDSGRLFITGYSQGGHVAMATHKAMQAAGMTVTASGNMSGPYALEAFGDFAFTGQVGIYSTLFYPMLVTSYQRAYGNAYGPAGATAADFYESAYASTIEGLLPSATPVDQLIADGQIPPLALFDINTPVTGSAALDALLAIPPPPDPNNPATAANAIFRLGFGTGNLVKNAVRINYALDLAPNQDSGLVTLLHCVFGSDLTDPNCAAPTPTAYAKAANTPTLGLRADLYMNDLRDWFPAAPVMLCGGKLDPVVTYPVNTGIMSLWWQTNGVPVARTAAALSTSLVTVLDLETGLGPGDPFAPAEAAFLGTMGQIEQGAYAAAYAAWLAVPGQGSDTAGAAAAGTAAANAAYASNYHQTVEPFCQAAVRGYFANIP